jgi:hypothetical protein
MMEVFQRVDSKSFGSCALTLLTVEIPCSKSQPAAFNQLVAFNYAFTRKYIQAYLGHMRFHNWSPWKIDFVDLSRRTDHLATWLHWSFEYDDLIIAALTYKLLGIRLGPFFLSALSFQSSLLADF